MRIRPQAQARLRQGFQRRAALQSARYAPYLADAGQFAVRFEFGEVLGVFTRRERRRDVWLYAFTEGFMLFDDAQRRQVPAVPVRWREVTEVGEVWSQVWDPGTESTTTVLSAYSLRCADGRCYEILRSFENVQDQYGHFGRSLGLLMPAVRATMPQFHAIDDVIAACAR
jgi:hypothetical protein